MDSLTWRATCASSFAFVADFLKAAIVLHEVLEIHPSDRVVYIAALQQCIFNAGRAILERMIRLEARSTLVSSSSRSRLPSFTSTCRSLWAMVFAFILHGPRLTVFRSASDGLEFRRQVGEFSRVCESSKTHRLSQLIRAERSSNGS